MIYRLRHLLRLRGHLLRLVVRCILGEFFLRPLLGNGGVNMTQTSCN
jgi:hypothetical protein